MVRIKETQGRVCDKMDIMGFSSVDLVNDDGEGVVLDSVYPRSMDRKKRNIEILSVYNTLMADTPRGIINLVEEVVDEDDWFTIEDVVSDLIGWDDKKHGELLKKKPKDFSVKSAVDKQYFKKCYKELKITRADFVEFIRELNGIEGIISQDYIREIAECIADDVAEDVRSSADTDNWNGDDVRLAVGRVLCNRLHIVI